MVAPRLHPWHDIPTGPDVPDVVTAVIEIPRHSRNKYELDKELGLYRLDRVLHSSVQFPGDYGFIPQTLGDDGDPLDVLVVMTMPVFTGCLVEVRPVGIFHLMDRDAADEKIIAVPSSRTTQRYDRVRNYTDLPDITASQIQHFFEHYKDLEPGKWVKIERWGDFQEARRNITEGIERAKKA